MLPGISWAAHFPHGCHSAGCEEAQVVSWGSCPLPAAGSGREGQRSPGRFSFAVGKQKTPMLVTLRGRLCPAARVCETRSVRELATALRRAPLPLRLCRDPGHRSPGFLHPPPRGAAWPRPQPHCQLCGGRAQRASTAVPRRARVAHCLGNVNVPTFRHLLRHRPISLQMPFLASNTRTPSFCPWQRRLWSPLSQGSLVASSWLPPCPELTRDSLSQLS